METLYKDLAEFSVEQSAKPRIYRMREPGFWLGQKMIEPFWGVECRRGENWRSIYGFLNFSQAWEATEKILYYARFAISVDKRDTGIGSLSVVK